MVAYKFGNIFVALASMFCTCNSYASTSNFDGSYVGVGVGFTNTNFSMQQTSVISTGLFDIDINNTLKPYQNNFASVVVLGFMYGFWDKFTIGLQAGANFEHGNSSDHTILRESDTNLSSPSTTSVEFQRSLTLVAKPGAVVSSYTMLYGIIGPSWAKFKTTYSASDFQEIPGFALIESEIPYAQNYLSKWGVTFGVGVEQHLSKHCNLGLEYVYTHYGTLDTLNYIAPLTVNGDVTGFYSNEINNISVRTNKITLNLRYRF